MSVRDGQQPGEAGLRDALHELWSQAGSQGDDLSKEHREFALYVESVCEPFVYSPREAAGRTMSGEADRIINSACSNSTHDRCPGSAYIGHGGMPPTPNYAACECQCHVAAPVATPESGRAPADVIRETLAEDWPRDHPTYVGALAALDALLADLAAMSPAELSERIADARAALAADCRIGRSRAYVGGAHQPGGEQT